jgi:D-alanyl-D-alanine carboxypeptidase (penicillin-binding protein 5/6)
VTIASSSVRVDGQKQTLYAGERLHVRDLMAMMLIESSNDAAYALADYAHSLGIDFVAKMNTKAWVLGMTDCVFHDPAGLDDTAYCSARDMVRLTRAALRNAPQLWSVMASPEVQVRSIDGSVIHDVKSTDELLGTIPGIIGAKTGNTDGALGCLLLVVQSADKRDTLISVVLGSRQRFADSAALISWAWEAYHIQQ